MHPANYHSIIREEGKPVAADKIFFLLHSTTSIWHEISEKRQTLLCHTLLFLFFARFLSDDLFGTVLSFPAKKWRKKCFSLFCCKQKESYSLSVFSHKGKKSWTKLFRYVFVLLLFCSNHGYQPPEPQTFRTYNGSREAWKGKGWTNLKHFLLRCGLPWQQRYQVRRMERKLSASKKDRKSSNISAILRFF